MSQAFRLDSLRVLYTPPIIPIAMSHTIIKWPQLTPYWPKLSHSSALSLKKPLQAIQIWVYEISWMQSYSRIIIYLSAECENNVLCLCLMNKWPGDEYKKDPVHFRITKWQRQHLFFNSVVPRLLSDHFVCAVNIRKRNKGVASCSHWEIKLYIWWRVTLFMNRYHIFTIHKYIYYPWE